MIATKLLEEQKEIQKKLEEKEFANPVKNVYRTLLENVLSGARKGKTWAVNWIFANLFLPLLDFEEFEVLYDGPDRGKERVEPSVLFKIIVLREMRHYRSDQATLDALEDNTPLQNFVGISGNNEIPCRLTLSRFRKRLKRHYEETGEDLVTKQIILLLNQLHLMLLKCFPDVDYRIDSTMMDSFAKRISRTELFYLTNRIVVKRMAARKEEIPEKFARYLDERDKNRTFYHKKSGGEYDGLTEELLADSLELLALAGEATRKDDEFGLLERLVNDQTATGGDGTVRLLDPKEVASGALQTPFDPDATYRYKRGDNIGFVANFVEAVYRDKKGRIACSLIIHFQTERNNYSDSLFLKVLLKQMSALGTGKSLLACDAAYYSADNEEACGAKGIELAPTQLTGRETNPFMAGFELDREGTAFVSCPGGAEPRSQGHSASTGQVRVSFPIDACRNCPHLKECRPELKKRVATVRLSKATVARAKVLTRHTKEEVARISDLRNGVESVPSQLKNTYKINDNRFRGLFYAGLKVALSLLALSVVKIYRSMANPKNREHWRCLLSE